jgi:hypothetical protein
MAIVDGITMDGVTAVDGVMKGMADGVVDTLAANALSPTKDMAKDTITADPTGHRISPTIV